MLNKRIIKFILMLFSIAGIQTIKAQSNTEITMMLSQSPNIEEGKKLFDICSKCHGVEGWGSSDGDFPQLAGQHRSVIIKQLLDIRSGKRNNPVMLPVILELSQYGNQAIIDVAAYIETLKMDPEPEVGEAEDDVLKTAQATYAEKCASCHGVNGEGKAEKFYPLLQGQHYEYLLRQLKNIQSNERKNSDQVMKKIISKMSPDELDHLADFISRMEPLEGKVLSLD